jgi:putative membrane protein
MMGGYGGCCGLGWFGGMGGYGWTGLILNVLIILGFILLVVWAVRKVMPTTTGSPFSYSSLDRLATPKEILAVRYARGEIDRDEYQNMLADLE